VDDVLMRLAEIERRLANVVRIGTVAEADYGRARVRVAIGDLLTDWLMWLTPRAGGDRTWWAPEVGEQVLVFSPYGELAAGVVLPALYSTAHPANGNSPEITRIDWGDGGYLEHDRASGKLTLHASGDVEITADGNMKLTATRIDLN